ncbi:protein FAR1-RELATED SEQUENCE 9 isoform X2 [Syzygium oleosum]|uniref:protein FAR1-RELATED SEQUENCE 9 isoform X2 n=1 Tax=Syzygium oleosum TaxID=219896 RepID=UPI0024BB1C43|nr:protein FAR1-RELATED SEQUENCE 9 isoform X2 [Syzygium oleosum]
MSSGRERALGVGGQHVLDYLKRMQAENPAFFYAVEGDDDYSGGNIFWADATARMNYTHFGDAVTFDTTYRTNRHRVPFASFTGLNHHGQPVLFGCALIVNDLESSFIWVLQTWLHSMAGRHPVSITTDPDGVIQVAVSQVLPGTRHRFCKWGIFRDTQDKLADLYQSHPTFEFEFKRCINEAETIDEFEASWESLLQRYYITDKEWLQSIYSAREQWVPLFMRDTFFGDLGLAERSEGLNTFFDGYVNASTTIQMLIKQCEKAVANWHEKELKADYDTTNTSPVLKTPSPMEKQAARLFTRRIFMKFQEELVETLANPATKIEDSGAVSTYRVAKYGEERKAHTVSFNSFEMKANCSCQMFEYTGIICRHILAVFRAENVLTLPSQYILKRWTRNAKIGSMTDENAPEPTNPRESLTVRYNNLRQEAIKYVEDGAKSIYIYNVAMDALQEAAKKVAVLKNKGPGAALDGNLANGGSKEFHASGENHMLTFQSVVVNVMH